jgi:hypothetical protein
MSGFHNDVDRSAATIHTFDDGKIFGIPAD